MTKVIHYIIHLCQSCGEQEIEVVRPGLFRFQEMKCCACNQMCLRKEINTEDIHKLFGIDK